MPLDDLIGLGPMFDHAFHQLSSEIARDGVEIGFLELAIEHLDGVAIVLFGLEEDLEREDARAAA